MKKHILNFDGGEKECFCGCNSYDEYSGGFPFRQGISNNQIKLLQIALNEKFPTPSNMRIVTPTVTWGPKTQDLILYHGLPTVINNQETFDLILEGKNPNDNVGMSKNYKNKPVFEDPTQTNTSTPSSGGWKDTLKNPSQALGMFGQLTESLGKLRNRNQNQQMQNLNNRGGQFVDTQFGFGNNQGSFQWGQNTNQQPRRLPMAAWIAIGLVVLLLVVFLIMRISKS
ncbi:MAG: hypothetical protein MUC49_02300 [Raineya sp.]|jgi:hypothetical protein|nr:hypothetical protein [Raineya sp.]